MAAFGFAWLSIARIYRGSQARRWLCDWPQGHPGFPYITGCKSLRPKSLKSNPQVDGHSKSWFEIVRYNRKVLAAQDTRCFLLGYTLCGLVMRLWEFGRLGGMSSLPFDISKDGLQFISAILGYLWMSEKQLGFLIPQFLNSRASGILK